MLRFDITLGEERKTLVQVDGEQVGYLRFLSITVDGMSYHPSLNMVQLLPPNRGGLTFFGQMEGDALVSVNGGVPFTATLKVEYEDASEEPSRLLC